MSNAPAPTRGDKIVINFGPLITIPVTVFNGIDADATKVVRNQFTPAGNRTSNKTVDSITGEDVARSEITMKYATDAGVEVELADDEMAEAMGVENGTSELVGVFPLSESTKYVAAGPVQVRPQVQRVGKKSTRPFDKAYALFIGALSDADSFALVKYVSRGKPKLLAVLGDGSATMVHWENEVREAIPEPVVEVSEAELAMGAKLIKQLSQPVAPVMVNDAVEACRKYAETKASGQGIKAQVPTAPASMDDLTALLEASLKVA